MSLARVLLGMIDQRERQDQGVGRAAEGPKSVADRGQPKGLGRPPKA